MCPEGFEPNISRTRVYSITATSTRSVDPSCEANSRSARQEISHMLWKSKVHYLLHKTPPLDPILNETIPNYTLSALVYIKIHFNIIFPSSLQHSVKSKSQTIGFIKISLSCTEYCSPSIKKKLWEVPTAYFPWCYMDRIENKASNNSSFPRERIYGAVASQSWRIQRQTHTLL